MAARPNRASTSSVTASLLGQRRAHPDGGGVIASRFRRFTSGQRGRDGEIPGEFRAEQILERPPRLGGLRQLQL